VTEAIDTGAERLYHSLTGRHRLSDVWQALRADIRQYLAYSAAFMDTRLSPLRVIGTMLTPSLMFVSLYRLAHWFWVRDWRWAATVFSRLNFFLHKGYIAPYATIGPGLYVAHPFGVVFEADAGRNLAIYPRCFVTRMEFIDPLPSPDAPTPRLGDDVTLAVYANTTGSVAIGGGSHIGPNLSVSRDVPENALVIPRDRIVITPPEEQDPASATHDPATDVTKMYQRRPQDVPDPLKDDAS
jgi:serine O-acetyltransferase